MVKQHQTTTIPTPSPQDNRQFDFVSATASVTDALAAASRTMKTAAIQNEFTVAHNGPGDGVYKTTIQIAANERKGIASGVVAPTTTSYDASEAYSLNNQNDYDGDGGADDDVGDDDDDDDFYYDYNPDTKENVAQTDDDSK